MRWRTGGATATIPARAASVPYLFTTGTPTAFIDFTEDINAYGFGFRDFEMWVDVAGVDYGIKHVNVNQTTPAKVIFYFPDNGRGPKPKGEPDDDGN